MKTMILLLLLSGIARAEELTAYNVESERPDLVMGDGYKSPWEQEQQREMDKLDQETDEEVQQMKDEQQHKDMMQDIENGKDCQNYMNVCKPYYGN